MIMEAWEEARVDETCWADNDWPTPDRHYEVVCGAPARTSVGLCASHYVHLMGDGRRRIARKQDK